MKLLQKIFGDPNVREIRKTDARIARINELESTIKKLTDKQLLGKTAEFRKKLEGKAKLDDLLEEAFAVVREASHRTLGMRHFDVQLVGGIVLHEGKIAEMRTGEGKTLVATLPLYLNALEGKGAHLVTVNEFLARLGAGWNGPLYHALGMSVGVVVPQGAFVYDPEHNDESHFDKRLQHLREVEKREAYGCDITYGTNNEYGFDYLRDNMVQDISQCVQGELHYAIVDEVDSILIDEARTPLIISQPSAKSSDRYYQFADIARALKIETDYTVDEKARSVAITDDGIKKVERKIGVDNLYDPQHIESIHLIEQSLKAKALFVKDKDYVISEDGEVIIVDEFTGRLLQGRRYSEGLHQAIEAKEGLQIQAESQTLATITFQNLFRLYDKLAGMTGTAATEAEEFAKIYSLEVTSIPTHKPMIRNDLKDRIYKSESAKFAAVVEEVRERNQTGQPILLGTASIEKNEVVSKLLSKAGIAHNMLNAKNNESEAETISKAGQRGAVTLATNIAGRGTDIVLGEGVVELGGLHVLGTERHESRRIDNQLRGRAGRQGDPGSSQFFVSLDDDLMRIFGGERIGTLMSSLQLPDDMPIENKMITRALETAQKRVEGHNFDIRKHLVEYDDVMNSHREVIYKRRRLYLTGQDIKKGMLASFSAIFERIVRAHTDAHNDSLDLEKIQADAGQFIVLPKDWATKLPKKLPADVIANLSDLATKQYVRKEKELTADTMRMVERFVCLQVVDSAWLRHLETMEHLREGIGLRGYGQRDPLVEYKAEGFRLFNDLLSSIDAEIASLIFKVQLQPQEVETPPQTELTQAAERAIEIGANEDAGSKADVKASRKAKSRTDTPELKPIRKKAKKKKKKR